MNTSEAKKHNILIITSDQLTFKALGCYGNKVCKTPNMDKLAQNGVRFSTAISNAPICMPGRSVLISGQYNRSCTGGVGNISYPSFDGDYNLPEYPFYGRQHLKDTTLAEKLKSEGYYNAVIGKWHIHSWPQDVGFDEYVIPRVHHVNSSQMFTEDGKNEVCVPGWAADFELEKAEDFFKRQAGSENPFFLYYNISPPHPPVADIPEKFLSMYKPEDIELSANADEARITRGERMAWDQDKASYPFKVHRWDYRYYGLHLPFCEDLPADYDLKKCIAEYYGAVTWTDEILGRLLKSLEDNGLSDNTWIIFTADHGELLGAGGLLGKGNSRIESVGIPFIAAGPEVSKPGKVIENNVVSLVDIAPTVAQLNGIEAADCWQGNSVADLLTGDGCRNDNFAIVETSRGSLISIRTVRYMAEFELKDGTLNHNAVKFFDLENDPYEIKNLEGLEINSEKLQEFYEIVKRWDKKTAWLKE